MTPEPIIIKSTLPPGDIMTMTTAIKSLHDLYPGRYLTAIETLYPEIWKNNPFLSDVKEGKVIELGYPEIQKAGDVSINFLQGFILDLEKKLNIHLRLTTNKPDLYFTDNEKENPPFLNLPKQYIVFNAGVKKDYTAKQWPIEYYQEVVNYFKNKISFVQIGRAKDLHYPINGAINLIEKTTIRELICLCLHAVGGLCPVTFLQHIMASAEKPCTVLVGGRENISWVASYPYQTLLHRIGSSLPCCKKQACWLSRIMPLYDDKLLPGSNISMDKSLCKLPVTHTIMPVAKCMYDIKPIDVIKIIETYI